MSEVNSPTPSRSPHWPALDGWRGFTIWFAISVHAGYFTGGGVLSLDTFFASVGVPHHWAAAPRVAATRGHRSPGVLGAPRTAAPPALFVVLAAVVVYAAFVASPLGLDTLRGDVLSTLGYSANWRFVLSGQSYFSSFTTPSPVLHMWSLAVEEQFYLVWPLVVLGVLWVARRRLSTTGAIVAVGVVAGVGAIVGDHHGGALHAGRRRVARLLRHRHACASDARRCSARGGGAAARPRAHPRRADRALDRRRAVARDRGRPVVRGRRGEIHDVFYGRFGLLAYSVATAVVLWRLTQPSVGWFGRVLESSPLRWVGAISYEMYLWHWPTYLFLTEQRTALDGGWLLALRLATVVALSWVTNVLVSGPIRRGVRLRSPRLARSAVVDARRRGDGRDLRRDRGRRTGPHR